MMKKHGVKDDPQSLCNTQVQTDVRSKILSPQHSTTPFEDVQQMEDFVASMKCYEAGEEVPWTEKVYSELYGNYFEIDSICNPDYRQQIIELGHLIQPGENPTEFEEDFVDLWDTHRNGGLAGNPSSCERCPEGWHQQDLTVEL